MSEFQSCNVCGKGKHKVPTYGPGMWIVTCKNCRTLKTKWFTTDKLLPDGWYWWRESKTEKPYPVLVEEGILIMDDDEKKWEWFYSGEFCKIEFPG